MRMRKTLVALAAMAVLPLSACGAVGCGGEYDDGDVITTVLGFTVAEADDDCEDDD